MYYTSEWLNEHMPAEFPDEDAFDTWFDEVLERRDLQRAMNRDFVERETVCVYARNKAVFR